MSPTNVRIPPRRDRPGAAFAGYGILEVDVFDNVEYNDHDADAVGRVGYSDRDPTPMGVDGPGQVSF